MSINQRRLIIAFVTAHVHFPTAHQQLMIQIRSQQQRPGWVFFLLLMTNLINNFDTGVIPAALLNIEKELSLDYKQVGLIGSMDYFGVSLGSMVLPFIFKRVSIRALMIGFLLLNSAMSALIAESYSIYLVYLARFLQGFTQSYITSYTPIWINEFAPRQSATFWLGLFGGFSTLGIMLGYTTGAIFLGLFGSWRACFFVQTGIQMIIAAGVYFLAEGELNVWLGSAVDESSEFDGFNQVVKCPVFLVTTGIMCCLYFVVTAIQYWATAYAVQVFGLSQANSNFMFSGCAISAPILGVILGGKLIDKLGGYRGNHERMQALKSIALFAFAGNAFGIGFNISVTWYFTLVNLWLLLFFGGAMVPVCNGIIVSSFDKSLQPYATAVMQVSMSVLGYFLAPLATGAVMDMYADKTEGLAHGLHFGISMCTAGTMLSLLNVYMGYREPPLKSDGQV